MHAALPAAIRVSAVTLVVLLTSAYLSAVSAQESGRVVEVGLGDNYYRPQVIRVKPGDRIVFINKGKQLHALTLIDREELLDEEYLDPGKSFTFAVALPAGEYPLGCNIHMDMRAKIVVR